MKLLKKCFALILACSLAVPAMPSSVRAAAPYEKDANEFEWDILKIVNEERMKEGIAPLSMFPAIQKAAHVRGDELTGKFMHIRPNGESFFTALKEQNIVYKYAGENIAGGQKSPKEVMTSWMNSRVHRAQIVNEHFTHIGTHARPGGEWGINWLQLYVGQCQGKKISVEGIKDSYKPGTSIDSMALYLTVSCDTHPVSYAPVIDGMCSGYNKDKQGDQTVSVQFGGLKTSFKVSVGEQDQKPGAPGKVKGLKASANKTTSLKLTWNKQDKAAGYEVYRFNPGTKKYTRIKTQTGTSFTDKKLKAATAYQYKVRAYQKNGSGKTYGAYSTVIKTSTIPGKLKVKAQAGKKSVTLSWKKVNGASGYQVYMADSKNGAYKKTAGLSKNSKVKYTKKSLRSGKTYYFKVRAYKKANGKTYYGSFTQVKSKAR